jgi:mannose-6-phosphate isomerase-like protein (cupin superfamily)
LRATTGEIHANKGDKVKRSSLSIFLAVVLSFSLPQVAKTQTITEKKPVEADGNRPNIITLRGGEPVSIPYDAGSLRMLAPSADTSGAWSLVELIEMPGYHTNLHRHIYTDEAFYVLEGTLTVKMQDKISEYPAGSYVLVPRGTPHAQGNRGTVPVKLLLTMTPGGFERSFIDRAELFKTTKPSDPDFRKKRKDNATKGNYDVEFLADWDLHH